MDKGAWMGTVAHFRAKNVSIIDTVAEFPGSYENRPVECAPTLLSEGSFLQQIINIIKEYLGQIMHPAGYILQWRQYINTRTKDNIYAIG